MNKSDIIKAVVKTNRCSQKRATENVNFLLEVIRSTLQSGDEISIRGFGRLFVKQRAQRRGRNFATGKALTIKPRKVVAFKGSAKLIERLNQPGYSTSTPAKEFSERRSQHRLADLPDGIAVVRIAGIPVYRFKLKNVSENGTSFLVQDDSNILRNIHVGQEIDIRVGLNAEDTVSTVYQRCAIRHITRQKEGRFKAHFIIGVEILGRLVTKL